MTAANRLGFLPMVLVASGIAAANAYGFMPVVRQSGDEILSIWLQVCRPALRSQNCNARQREMSMCEVV